MAKSFGERLSELRKGAQETQEDMALALNVTPQAISKWENDVSLPGSANLPAIARYFNVSIDYLFGVDDVNPTPIPESVFCYVSDGDPVQAFEKAFEVYTELHDGVWRGSISREELEHHRLIESHTPIPTYTFFNEGFSLYHSSGYGNLVKCEFLESISFETAEFSRTLIKELAEPGALEIIFCIIARTENNFITFTELINELGYTSLTENAIKERINSLLMHKIIEKKFRESVEDCAELTYCISFSYYFAVCSLIAALRILETSQGAVRGKFDFGGYQIRFK